MTRTLPRPVLYILSIITLVFALGMAVYFVFAFLSKPMPPHPFFRADDATPLVIAHQGGDGERPSNTMVAFQHAVDIGVDILEMDIHSTADGVLVVIHDDTIDRTTDGSGRVNDFTFEELQQFDAAYNWPTLAEESDRTDRPYRGQGITIPALDEVLTAFPQMRMVIEIKQVEPPIHQDLCDMLREYNLQEQVVVASFRPEAMYAFREVCPEVATAGVEEEILPFYFLMRVGLAGAYQPTAHVFSVPETARGLPVTTPGFVRAAADMNVAVQPWTINSDEAMDRILALDVQGIITDYPTRLMEKLGR